MNKVLVTGAFGLVGSALMHQLPQKGYCDIIAPSSKECNFLNKDQTIDFFLHYRPDYVFHCAARVYGILGNMNNVGLGFYENLLVNTHVIEACRLADVKKVVAMGTGCIYPYPPVKLPLTVEDIWSGIPHSSEIGYAHAKRTMLAHLECYKQAYGMNYTYAISGNIYGPNDHYDLQGGHVIPSLIRKFFEARKKNSSVSVWGNGSAQRDFVFSYDLADALILMLEKINGPVNVASGYVHSILEVVEKLQQITKVSSVEWDRSKPNGQAYRAYDLTDLFEAGFCPKYNLETGLNSAYEWFEKNYQKARK